MTVLTLLPTFFALSALPTRVLPRDIAMVTPISSARLGACGGELACSTCHVVLAQADFDRLEEPEEEEEDMLDLAWGLTDTSRLCCQIEVEEWMEGMVVTLPDESNNMMD